MNSRIVILLLIPQYLLLFAQYSTKIWHHQTPLSYYSAINIYNKLHPRSFWDDCLFDHEIFVWNFKSLIWHIPGIDRVTELSNSRTDQRHYPVYDLSIFTNGVWYISFTCSFNWNYILQDCFADNNQLHRSPILLEFVHHTMIRNALSNVI